MNIAGPETVPPGRMMTVVIFMRTRAVRGRTLLDDECAAARMDLRKARVDQRFDARDVEADLSQGNG